MKRFVFGFLRNMIIRSLLLFILSWDSKKVQVDKKDCSLHPDHHSYHHHHRHQKHMIIIIITIIGIIIIITHNNNNHQYDRHHYHYQHHRYHLYHRHHQCIVSRQPSLTMLDELYQPGTFSFLSLSSLPSSS